MASLTCAHKTSALPATRHGSQQRRSPGFQSITSDWRGGSDGERFPPAWVPTRTGISVHYLRLKGRGGGGAVLPKPGISIHHLRLKGREVGGSGTTRTCISLHHLRLKGGGERRCCPNWDFTSLHHLKLKGRWEGSCPNRDYICTFDRMTGNFYVLLR